MKKVILKVFFIIFIISISSIFLHLSKNQDIKIMTLEVIKEEEIIKKDENLIKKQENISENKLSWVYISENYIITAYHWVNGLWKDIKLINNKLEQFIWKVYYLDEKNDLAIIKIDNKWEKIQFAKNYQIWDKVKTYSSYFWKKTGTIIDIKDDKIYSDIDLESGESGSWLWNEDWELIAINTEYDLINKKSISIKIDIIKELIN